MKKIKQINNLRIYELHSIYYVKSPDGKILEKFSSLPLAMTWCLLTKDFCSRNRK